MEDQDIRWIQRLSSFNKAFVQLENAVSIARERKLSPLEEQGMIQAFEYTHELAWKTLKDFLESKGGHSQMYGSKDVTRTAFSLGLIEDGEIWMSMIESRNQTSHTYNEESASEIINDIQTYYFDQFQKIKEKLNQLATDNQ